MGRIPHQHDIFMHPALTMNNREGPPVGAVRQDFMAAQFFFVQFGHIGRCRCLIILIQARSAPGIFGGFNNQRRQTFFVLVGMGIPDAVLVFLEGEGKGCKWRIGAQPDKTVGAIGNGGFEGCRICIADQ